MKTKIEWCDMTWNPVWGCENKCEYCYARKIAKRLHKKITNREFNYLFAHYNCSNYKLKHKIRYEKNIKNFIPTWIESNFNKSFPKKPSRIFVNSMSDIAFWKREWMDKILYKIENYPQHIFMFLTKDHKSYYRDFPLNCWLGITATNQNQIDKIGCYYSRQKVFISIEPIHEKIKFTIDNLDWLIIGAETGNRKNKIIPEKKWIEELIDINIPLFMKDNLKPYWNGKFRQEFPL